MSPAADLWDGLLGALGNGVRIKQVCVLKAYVDESGIHDESGWCVVAGHLGTDDQWNQFDHRWRIGLGARRSLHMTDLVWNSKRHRITQLLSRLGPIPDSCGLERVFGMVRGRDYLDLAPTEPEYRVLMDPYMLALWPCVIQTLKHVPRTERVLFTFEQHDNYSPLLTLIEDSLANDTVFNTPTGEPRAIFLPVPKGTTPRTEPADYLAFEMGQCLIDENTFKAVAGLSILGDHMMIGKQMRRDEIRAICFAASFLADRKNVQDKKRRDAIRALLRESEKRHDESNE